AVLEPALAPPGPTCSTRVCISPLGSGTVLMLTDCEPELELGSSIGTKITASAINTAAPSKRVFKPESIYAAPRCEVLALSGAPQARPLERRNHGRKEL